MNLPSSQLLWGEIHNHNELGYALGSLERSYDIARSHLDFYAFTPHSQFADGRAPEGYEIVNSNWGKIQRMAADQYVPGEFTTFLAYEWHSSAWGHVHIVCFEDGLPLHFAPSLDALQDHYRGQKVILVPHHIGYEKGVDWNLFDPLLSPIVEIYSEHGCSERDSGPHPMIGHSGGPAGSRFTAQHGLAEGKRFGFSAGTDNHDGYPGGYGLGLTGVRAGGNTREAIWEAIQNRRSLAVTGDRIDADLWAQEGGMGSILPSADLQNLHYTVSGWDTICKAELIRNNETIQLQTPTVHSDSGNGVYRLRLEYGWGPMKGYQIFDWEGGVTIAGGRLKRAVPCFTSDPFDEHRRKRITNLDEHTCNWQSHTSRGGVFNTRNGVSACSANDAICLEVEGTKDTRVQIEFHCKTRESIVATPADWMIANASSTQERSYSISELLSGRDGFRMGQAPSWVLVHRALDSNRYTLEGSYQHQGDPGEPAFYYLRITQENGQMAWTSPIWFGE
ncbi:MAG: hypothetical protein CME25_18720 [Gemmatimonadetes bacterium]|nr:hypothetical protein [Gemmatimonadota bacterium]